MQRKLAKTLSSTEPRQAEHSEFPPEVVRFLAKLEKSNKDLSPEDIESLERFLNIKGLKKAYAAHQQERLQSPEFGGTVGTQSWPEKKPVKRLPFLTVDEIKRFIGYDALIGILKRTENLAVIKLAHDLASELKRDVEAIVKERLWNGNAPEGELRFSETPKDNGVTYFNAKVGNSTRGIPREHFVELEQAERAHRQFRRKATPPDHFTIDHQ
jgi:hypothetical protein